MGRLRHSYLLLRGNAQPEHQEDARGAVGHRCSVRPHEDLGVLELDHTVS